MADPVGSFEGSIAVTGKAVLGYAVLFGTAPSNAANPTWAGEAPYVLPDGHAANFQQPAYPLAEFYGAQVGVTASFVGAHYGSTGVFDGSIPVSISADMQHGVNLGGTITLPLIVRGSDRWFSYLPVARRPSPLMSLRYSGGAGNSIAKNSIGGPVSATEARYAASQDYTACLISGITIQHATHNPVGPNGYLQYSTANHMLTWTDHAGAVSSTILTGEGWYAVGTTVAGYLRVYVTYDLLPLADTGQQIAITDAYGTLFDIPAGNELIAGSTEYRILYLVNESDVTMTDIKVTLIDEAPESSLFIGSTFNPLSVYATPKEEAQSFALFNHRTYTSAYGSSHNPLSQRERLIALYPAGTPRFLFFASDTTQNSDGETLDVEPQLQDRYDTTGKLGAVEWGTVLQWARLPAGRMVSLCVKRVTPPNPVTPLDEAVDFDITFTLT